MQDKNVNAEENLLETENSPQVDEVEARKGEIKTEDRKKVGIFALFCVLGGVIGFVGGTACLAISDYLKTNQIRFLDFFAEVQRSLAIPSNIALAVLGIVLLIVAVCFYKKAKKTWGSDRDEDEKYEKVDKIISCSLITVKISYFTNFMLYGIGFYALSEAVKNEPDSFALRMISGGIATIVFLICLFALIEVERRCVNLTKLMNPEKQGSVYDIKFEERWFESCDEAERNQIGMCSYRAFKVTNIFLLSLTVLFAVMGMVFEIGLLPLITVVLIAIVMNVAYVISELK